MLTHVLDVAIIEYGDLNKRGRACATKTQRDLKRVEDRREANGVKPTTPNVSFWKRYARVVSYVHGKIVCFS